MDKVSALLPGRIEDATGGTPIAMLTKIVEPRRIETFLAVELTKLQSLVNVDERLNLQSHQIPIIAEHLMTTFKNENLADFVICFKNGAMGKYDEKLLRLDGAVITQWMYKYLDEKYQVIETKLMREKENPYARPDASDVPVNSDEWFERWKREIGFVESESNDNSKVNELERQKMAYTPPDESELLKYELHIQYIRENYDAISGKPKPNWMEEKEWTEKRLNEVAPD